MELRPIPNFPGYFASDEGDIYSNKSGKLKALKPWLDKDGYRRVHLMRDCKKKGIAVAVLILTSFWDEKPSDIHSSNHKDGVKTNDRLNNLEWNTPTEQQHHAVKTGLKGKLTEQDVIEIKERLKGGEKGFTLAKEFGVYHSVIYKIRDNKNKVWEYLNSQER